MTFDYSAILRLFQQLDVELPNDVAKALFESCDNILHEIKSLMLHKVDEEAANLCKKNASVLYRKTYEDLSCIDFNEILTEIKTSFPFLVEMLHHLSFKNGQLDPENPDEFHPKIAMIYSIAISTRWNQLSSIKRLTTVAMIEGGCSKKVFFLLVLT